jgi:hypothetical protein
VSAPAGGGCPAGLRRQRPLRRTGRTPPLRCAGAPQGGGQKAKRQASTPPERPVRQTPTPPCASARHAAPGVTRRDRPPPGVACEQRSGETSQRGACPVLRRPSVSAASLWWETRPRRPDGGAASGAAPRNARLPVPETPEGMDWPAGREPTQADVHGGAARQRAARPLHSALCPAVESSPEAAAPARSPFVRTHSPSRPWGSGAHVVFVEGSGERQRRVRGLALRPHRCSSRRALTGGPASGDAPRG